MRFLTCLVALLGSSALLGSRAIAADGGYLFVTFKGERTPMTEQIYFATSADGRKWEALNGGEPTLVSSVGEKGVRDPYLVRAHDDKTFYLIATDLSIHLNPVWKRAAQHGSKSIVVWESTDLTHWSEPRLTRVSPDDAGCTWAPEAIYDETSGDYLVYWSSTSRSDDFKKFRIWSARTKDFKTFGPASVYVERPTPVIDADIVFENGHYYRFIKDERDKAITMDTAERLDGPWTEVPGFSLATKAGYEGPACYRLSGGEARGPGTWCLLLDHFAKGLGYEPFVTNDLASGQFKSDGAFEFPFKFRHGSVLPVTADELSRLKAAYPSTRPASR